MDLRHPNSNAESAPRKGLRGPVGKMIRLIFVSCKFESWSGA